MRMKTHFALLFSVSAVTARRVLQRGMASSGADFASRNCHFVVVGGGTAGLTVAARLSEDPNVTVCVLEAGQFRPDDPLINTPAFAFQMQGNPLYDWQFSSVPQTNLNDRSVYLARGKLLGGSSAINTMIWNRAPKEEYDAWTTLGNQGWDWAALLPCMKAAERFTEVDPFRLNYTNAQPGDIFPSQGTQGYIGSSYGSWYSDVTIPYGKSAKNVGIPPNFNPDSGDPFGIYNPAYAVNGTTGRRSYSASTYYAYNAHRSNFVVLTGAQATKVVFANSTGTGGLTATGVTFVHNSTTYTVSASREVILSAGVFQTPQLLELSGIGNPTILGQHGITPLVNLPGVGENLQDHLLVSTNWELKPGFTTLDILRNNATYAAEAQKQYNATGNGILASFGAILSFIDLKYVATPNEINTVIGQINAEIASSSTTPLQKAQYAIQRDWLTKKLAQIELIFYPVYSGSGVPKANTSYIGILPAGQHPLSRGTVHISSSNPLVPPSIDPKFLSKKFDQDVIARFTRFAQKIAQTQPLASLIVARESPPPSVDTNAELIQFIKSNSQTLNHAIGTAPMVPRDIGGVVDNKLKVYGTSNLRVVDASVIPLHISTHISRTVYGIAEKAAAMMMNRQC